MSTPARLRFRPSESGRKKGRLATIIMPTLAIIAAGMSLGCWLFIWIRLFQSLAQDSMNDVLPKLGKREDILAFRMKQYLNGTSQAESKKGFSSTNTNSSWVLKRLIDPQISKRVQEVLLSETRYPQLILGAFIEPPLQIDDNGFLQLRTHSPDNLTYASYPYKLGSNDSSIKKGACSQNGAQWTLPTFHPPGMDTYFEGNVFRKKPMFDKRWELALGVEEGNGGYCPVDADPYLPWIHDVFPAQDGAYVEFVISNKRRCNSDPKVFQSDLKSLEPQVALVSLCVCFNAFLNKCALRHVANF